MLIAVSMSVTTDPGVSTTMQLCCVSFSDGNLGVNSIPESVALCLVILIELKYIYFNSMVILIYLSIVRYRSIDKKKTCIDRPIEVIKYLDGSTELRRE